MSDSQNITFVSEGIDFELKFQNEFRGWIAYVITKESKLLGDVTYVFCSDTYLHKINLEQLKHDDYTDIITFDYCVADILNSDIFISVDRIAENAGIFKTTFQKEISRVIIHGILHLIGYDDKSDHDKEIMRHKEDFYLSLQTF